MGGSEATRGGPPVGVVLMYHDLAPAEARVDPDRRPYVLELEAFLRHLAILREQGTRLFRVCDWARQRKAPGAPSSGQGPFVVLTFDDGDLSNFTRALPALQQAGLPATFFLTVGRIGDPGYMSWGQVHALHAAGMEIGSHTLTHRPPINLSDSDLRYEVTESKKRLEDRLGVAVESLSSPTGFFDGRMSRAAREAGYASLCGGRIGIVDGRADPYTLPRIPIKRGVTDEQFRRVVRRNRPYLFQLRARQMVRNGLKRILGTEAYLRWRRRYLRARGAR